MPRFCHSCGAALAEQEAFCPACGTPVAQGSLPIKSDSHRAAVSAAIEPDRRVRFLGLAIATLALILIGIVAGFANHSSPHDTGPAGAVTASTNEPKPSPAPREDSAPGQHGATQTAAALEDNSEDHELHEDGRVYSVAVVAGTSEIPVGAKLFVQGRVSTFDYASGMRSRPFVIIEDEQQPRKTLLCGMTQDEGSEVFSLYHVGEIVAVSGEYIATASIDNYRYPTMPLFARCEVADPQNNVVRPAEVARSAQPANGETQFNVPTQPETAANQSTERSRTAASLATPSPLLQFESGVRVLVHVVSISRQANGSFAFRGTLLQPVVLAGGASLGQSTELAGSGTVSGGHVTVAVTGLTVQGENYGLQREASGANKKAGSGPAIELDPGKVIEMWFASASAYERTADESH
jgi:hypothetical protein